MLKLKLGVNFITRYSTTSFYFWKKEEWQAQRTVSDSGPDPQTRLLPRAPVHAGLKAMTQPGAGSWHLPPALPQFAQSLSFDGLRRQG